VSRLLADAHVVRGSAYPEQTRQEIVEIFGAVDEDLKKTLGASASELANLIWAITKAQIRRVEEFVATTRGAAAEAAAAARPSLRRGASKRQRRAAARQGQRAADAIGSQLLSMRARVDVPVSPADCHLPDGTTPTNDLWRQLQALIGLTVTAARRIRDVLQVRTRPLFVLDDRRVLIGDPGNALDSLWDALETYAKRRPSIYETFQDRRHAWLEEHVVHYLSRVFGANAVFRNLLYPDPDRPGGTAELDAAAIWGPFLVIVEAKAMHFRFGAQLGNIGMLRDDLRENVEHAFEQALRARRYLRSVDTAEYRERDTGRVLQVRAQDLQRVYLVTVSLHLLGRPLGRLAHLRALGLMTHGEYPWALSISELDIVTRFTEGPDVLLHYIEQRHGIELRGAFPLADEVDLFGAYLATRLNEDDFKAQMPDATLVHLQGFQEPVR
jgi:hypothetical protein